MIQTNTVCILFLAAVFSFPWHITAQEPLTESEYENMRHNMVSQQIERRGIKNPLVLEAMESVARHRFVPLSSRYAAYDDNPLPIGEGQTISQPYIVALMTELLEPDSTKTVLEIGTGSGYQAAVLAEVFQKVYTIEIIEKLGTTAKTVLDDIGYENIMIKIGDGYKGWKKYAPFDGIIVTCAPSHVPEPLQNQLSEGGIMVIPVGEYLSQDLVVLKKKQGKLEQKEVIPVRFVPMMKDDGSKY